MAIRHYHLDGPTVNEWYSDYEDAAEAYKELYDSEPGLSLSELRVVRGRTHRVWLAGSKR